MNAPETTRIGTPPGPGSGGYRGAIRAPAAAQGLPARSGAARLHDPAQSIAGLQRPGRRNNRDAANRCFDCCCGFLFG